MQNEKDQNTVQADKKITESSQIPVVEEKIADKKGAVKDAKKRAQVKKDWAQLEKEILERKAKNGLMRVVNDLEDRLEKFGSILANTTYVQLDDKKKKKKKKKGQKCKNQEVTDLAQGNEQTESQIDEALEDDLKKARLEDSELNPSDLSEFYEDDDVPSEIDSEHLEGLVGDDFVENDEFEAEDSMLAQLPIPIPSQSDYFVHVGDLASFPDSSGFKNHTEKVEKIRESALAQKKHEQQLIEEEKNRIKREKNKVYAERKKARDQA